MELLRSYVVRVYRHESDDLAGVIESIETGHVTPFRTAAEVWAALSRSLPVRRSLPTTTTNQEDGK